MGANPTIRLSIVRSQIDQQQQVIALLENRLQEAILGGTTGDPTITTTEQTLPGLLQEIANIYGDEGDAGLIQIDANGNEVLINEGSYEGLTGAIWRGVFDFMPRERIDANGDNANMPLEQDTLRQLLYQARALLGELRVEEQHWNGEVNEEKARRKELGDLSKA